MIEPFTHAVTPAEQGGVLLPHGTPVPAMPSSVWPSQSLSMLSQTSCVGPMSFTQSRAPPTHTTVPAAHAPVSVPHVWPTWGTLSSTWPLQLLSMLSQTSGLGGLGFWQVHPAAPLHTSVP